MILRCIALVLAFVALVAPSRAEERITSFDVEIRVEKDGDIVVTEDIGVVSEGDRIRRGVFRDLPRFYLKGAERLPYGYAVRRVTRDGEQEPYAVERDGNAFRIRIGDADVFLQSGPHRYVIEYEVKNQVRYFEAHDEVYWNATGNFWAFPIERATATVRLPDDADAVQRAGYTGRQGESGQDYAYARVDGAHRFATRRVLAPGEGLTVAVGFAKGVVDPPSAADARAEWWARNASAAVLSAGLALVGAFYVVMFGRVGRDPPKGPIFPRYEPPAGYSPAATHHVYHRGLSGHDALIATVMNLAVGKRLVIDADRKTTTLTRGPGGDRAFAPEEMALEADLLGGVGEIIFGGKYNPRLTRAYTAFQKRLRDAYGPSHFRWNAGVTVPGLALSLGALGLALSLSIGWSVWHTGAALLIALVNLAAFYFMPAPTLAGQAARSDIEGFRLYLKTAEALQLNAYDVGADAPPPMTVERYERFLPYAVALGVEKPWTEHFEALMPRESAEYRPTWSSGSFGRGRSLAALNSALVGAMSSGVSSALPQSSSSSGSGGGGSSGGGGGGGGGGGW